MTGIIKHTRIALTALGRQADIDIVQNLYECAQSLSAFACTLP